MRILSAFFLAAFASIGSAQEMPKPGPEHLWLKKREGAWTFVMDMASQKSAGTLTYKMELGGFWLTSSMDCELFGQKFTGKNVEGYDPIKKKYTSVWTDSMSATAVITEGTFDEAKKTLTMTGDGPAMDGKMAKYKSVYVMTDDDTISMAMSIADQPAFTVTYKRKK